MTRPYWGGRRLARITAEFRARQLPCHLCGQHIDYTLTYPDPDSVSIEHPQARSKRPDLTYDPANQVPAHLRCNKTRGNRAQRPGIGQTSII